MYTISSPFSFTQSTDEQATFANRWVPTGISRLTSMALSIRWTPFACLYTNGFSPNGCVRGPEQAAPSWMAFNLHMHHNPMKWKSNHCDDAVLLFTLPSFAPLNSVTVVGRVSFNHFYPGVKEKSEVTLPCLKSKVHIVNRSGRCDTKEAHLSLFLGS
jgi:hypothetical protein